MIKKAGIGFISGQGIATISSLYHAVFKAPSGKEISDFYHEFKQNSKSDGVTMALWSILNTLIEPIVQEKVENKILQSIITGAASSAIMSIRNGTADMTKQAASGAIQSFALSMFESGIEIALKPLDLKMMKNFDDSFFKDRSEAVLRSPTESISSVFF